METTTIGITGLTAGRQVELQNYVQSTFAELDAALSAFSQDEFNRIPFEGSWTPGQVAGHLIKAVGQLPDLRTAATSRPYDEHVAEMDALFLNFSIKMQSPEFVRPGNLPQDKEEVLAVFHRKHERLGKTIGSVDMTALCLDFEMPMVGLLTRYEWVRFFCCHIRRHTWQLGNILKALRGA